MSPYIAFKIFEHQPVRSDKRHERSGTHSPARRAKYIVWRLRRWIRRTTKVTAPPGQTLRMETNIDKPAMEGSAK